MSKTKIQIEVDEDQFKSLIEKEITDLPKDQIQKIIIESIKSYLTGDETIKIEEVTKNSYNTTIYPVEVNRKNYNNLNALLIKKEDYYNGTSYKPSDLFINLLKECDYSGLQEVVDKMINDLKDNYHSILLEILSDRLTSGIMNTTSFRNGVEEIIRNHICIWEMNNSQK
jgi:hypothetical protein